MIRDFCGLLALIGVLLPGCSSSTDFGDDDTSSGEDCINASTTTPAPSTDSSPDPFPDQLGVYQVRNAMCALVDGYVFASGEMTVSETTTDVLCAWGGTETLPVYGYACLPVAATPGVWSTFSLNTGYSPAIYGEDPEDIECVLCSANSSGPDVCYTLTP